MTNPTAETPTPATPATPWYKRWLRAIGIGARAVARVLYEIIAQGVRSAALQFVNDQANQAAAIEAVKVAMREGLKGTAAWHVARDALLNQLGESAWSIADNWLDTLLQSAYFAVKNTADQE